MCCEQELLLRDANGALVARARERSSNCAQCCSRTFVVVDTQGSVFYTLRANECGYAAGAGCNACGPSCCNPSFDVYAELPSGLRIDMPRFIHPRWKSDGSGDVSNFLVPFPKGSTPVERAALLAGLYMIETATP